MPEGEFLLDLWFACNYTESLKFCLGVIFSGHEVQISAQNRSLDNRGSGYLRLFLSESHKT